MYIFPHPLHCHCFPICKMYSASNYFLVQKEIGKRNAELKKSLLKTVVKYKDYVIETGNFISTALSYTVQLITSVLFCQLRQSSAWSLKQGICCKVIGCRYLILFWHHGVYFFFTRDTLALGLSLHTTHGYWSGLFVQYSSDSKTI